MERTTAFGKPIPSSMASAVLDAASLNQAPSPSQPDAAPPSGLANRYATLYALASEALTEETDDARRLELERIVAFFDSTVAELGAATTSGGAPAPTPAPPPVPPAMASAPPAAPAAIAPGMPQAPPPGAPVG